MTTGVVYSRYKQSALFGKFELNGDRQYQLNFSEATMKMGIGHFHFLDEMGVKIFYRGYKSTCGRKK